jgi:hypothetical protein
VRRADTPAPLLTEQLRGLRAPVSVGAQELASAGHPVERIAVHLRSVLRYGVRPARLVNCLDLLSELERGEHLASEAADCYADAQRLAQYLAEALNTLGEGPVGAAGRSLFGATAETRGRLLKDRRRIAADHLDVLPSSFRKYHERDIILDVAFALWQTSRSRVG